MDPPSRTEVKSPQGDPSDFAQDMLRAFVGAVLTDSPHRLYSYEVRLPPMLPFPGACFL